MRRTFIQGACKHHPNYAAEFSSSSFRAALNHFVKDRLSKTGWTTARPLDSSRRNELSTWSRPRTLKVTVPCSGIQNSSSRLVTLLALAHSWRFTLYWKSGIIFHHCPGDWFSLPLCSVMLLIYNVSLSAIFGRWWRSWSWVDIYHWRTRRRTERNGTSTRLDSGRNLLIMSLVANGRGSSKRCLPVE